MALFDLAWYVNSVGYTAVAQYSVGATYAAGALVRQLTAPSTNNERVFVCTVAGVAGAEPTWVVTRGAKNTSTVTFQECTGHPALNGDSANTFTWSGMSGGVPTVVTLGQIIQRNSGGSIWICSTGGTTGSSEPSWPSNTAGDTVIDGTVTWTCLGLFSAFSPNNCPHARIQNALANTWYSIGDTVWVTNNHAESQTTATNWTSAGSNTSFGYCLCYDHNVTSLPPVSLSSGASIATTATLVDMLIANSSMYFYGVNFIPGQGVNTNTNSVKFQTAGGSSQIYEQCTFQLANTTTNNLSFIDLGAANTGIEITWIDCQVKFATTTQSITVTNVTWKWQNPGGKAVLMDGSAVPSRLLNFGAFSVSGTSNIVWDGLDLTQLPGTIDGYSNGDPQGTFILNNCVFNASASITQPQSPGHTVQVFRNGNLSERYQAEGTESTELTITRVNGAADPSNQKQSRLYTTASSAAWIYPFKPQPLSIWNTRVGKQVIVTVSGTWQRSRTPFNDEIWLEIEYLAASSQGKIISTGKSGLLAANAAYARDSSTWNGGGSGGGWSPFLMRVVLDNVIYPFPQTAGMIWVRPKMSIASTSIYLDPKIVLTNS